MASSRLTVASEAPSPRRLAIYRRTGTGPNRDASGGVSVGCLPLAEGYTATYRNYDLTKMKIALWQLKVADSGSVTVPAGKFDTYKVEASSADGGSEKTTFWIAKDSRQVVKSVAGGPGGASITSELQ
jgi:hypothetical protein